MTITKLSSKINSLNKLMFSAVIALSFSASALPATLKDTMKSMSAQLKVISNQAGDPQLNESSVVATREFLKLVEHSKTFIPNKIEQMPVTEQTAQMQEYAKAIDGVVILSKDLIAAFEANDNLKANEIIKQLSAAKKDGHGKFK